MTTIRFGDKELRLPDNMDVEIVDNVITVNPKAFSPQTVPYSVPYYHSVGTTPYTYPITAPPWRIPCGGTSITY